MLPKRMVFTIFGAQLETRASKEVNAVGPVNLNHP